MLAKHPPQLLSGVPHRLIVVGKFRRPELAKQVSELFGDFQVRLIRSDDMPAFVEEIRNAAHT